MFENRSQGCIVCALRRIHLLGMIFGTSTVKWTCSHTTKEYTETKYTISNVKRFWAMAISMALSAFNIMIWYEIWLLYENSKSRSIIFFHLSATTYVLGAICSTMANTLQSSQRTKDLNGLIEIIKNTGYYKMKIIFSKHDQNKVKYTAHVMFLTIISLLLLGMSTRFVTDMSLIESYSFLVHITFMVVCVGVSSSDAITFISSIYIYVNIYKRITAHVKEILTEELIKYQQEQRLFQGRSQIRKVPTNHVDCPLHVRLQLVRRLYIATTFNVREMNEFFNPAKLVYNVLSGMLLIFNIYVVIMDQVENGKYKYGYTALIGLIASAIILILSWTSADRLILAATEIVPFLYTYPISKLDELSASETEMLLDTLSLRAPILDASGIYQISMTLFASMSGTIVTYVLVAMQFNIQYNETSNK